MKNFLEKIENYKISFGSIILIFYFAIFLRSFLEGFSNSNNLGMTTGFIDTFIHFPVWFITVFVGIAIVISVFTKKHISSILKLISFCSFIIVLPPIIDLIFYTNKVGYFYIVGTPYELIRQYLSLLLNTKALSIGIKIEIIIVLSSIFYYVYLNTKSFFRSIVATVLSYTIIFLMVALPNLVYVIYGLFYKMPSLSSINLNNYFFPINLVDQIFISRAYLSDVILGGVRFGMNQNLFSILMSQASLLIGILVSIPASILYFGKDKFLEIIKNFRFLRVGHYFFLVVLGIIFGQKYFNTPFNLYDYLSIICMFLGLFFAWLFAVWENDEIDRDIDTLSNPERPLIKGNFSTVEWKNTKQYFLILSILLATITGYTSLIIILAFIIIYHIYSIPPLRLKRYPIVSSALIGVNACLAYLLGFTFVSGDKPFETVSMTVLFGIFIFYLCVENIKNLKDIKGDMVDNILTIPVIFGEYRGKIITWALVFLGTFSVPLFIFPENNIFWVAPILGAVTYFFIVKENYKEKPLFIFYLIAFLILIILNS